MKTLAELSADTSDTLPIGYRLRDYEITRVIGRGGFGAVYAARRLRDDFVCAIKEYLPVAIAGRTGGRIAPRTQHLTDALAIGVKDFLREAELLSELSHPALVEVYEAWEENGTGYLVMAYYAGETLRARRASLGKPPSEAQIRTWMAPVFDAILELHAHRIIHRDISPDNIMTLDDGSAVLLDLGSARHVLGGMTQALTTVLKPGFAPIEQYVDDGSMSQGRWTDVYGLSGTLYFLATGEQPVVATSRLIRDKQLPLSKRAEPGIYSEALCSAVDKGLSVRAIDRYKSVGELRAALGWGSDNPLVQQTIESSEVAQVDLPDSLRPPTTARSHQPSVAAAPAPVLPPTVKKSTVAPNREQPYQPKPDRLPIFLAIVLGLLVVTLAAILLR